MTKYFKQDMLKNNMVDLRKIIVVPKMSKYEWDRHRLKLSHNQIISNYKKEGVSISKIMNSHKRQKENLDKLKKVLSAHQFVERDDFTQKIADKSDLVVSFGGDNHFMYLSHFVKDGPMIGINSDPKTSEGALTSCTVDEFKEKLASIQAGNFKIQEWPRLAINLNGKNIKTLAMCELFIGEAERKYMSRHIIKFNGKKEEQKCSGLLVSTGAGSTSWYNSACRYLFPNGKPFPRTAKYFKFLATEPYKGKLTGYSFLHGTVKKGDELIVNSLNDSKGILTLDALEELDFNRGAVAKIKLGAPLRAMIIS